MNYNTISSKCPSCGYIRHEIVHITNSCGGLLLRNPFGTVHCILCEKDLSIEVEITCPSCGHKKVVDLVNIEEMYHYSIVKMEVFETIIIFE